MSSPFANYPTPERSFIPANPVSRQSSIPPKPAPAKRGRKPKNAGTNSTTASPHPTSGPLPSSSQPTPVQWSGSQGIPGSPTAFTANTSTTSGPSQDPSQPTQPHSIPDLPGVVVAASTRDGTPAVVRPGAAPGEEDVEGEDELLPAMADDDYSAQLSFQSQSKDNLKCVVSVIFHSQRVSFGHGDV